MWAHDHRNEQYHGGSKGTPEKQVLDLIRRAALWVFSVLFEVRPDSDHWADYLDRAKMLRPELEQIEGFIDNVRYRSLMREGDKWHLVIPPTLGYGARGAGQGAIPPNQTLVFDVTLISTTTPKEPDKKPDTSTGNGED